MFTGINTNASKVLNICSSIQILGDCLDEPKCAYVILIVMLKWELVLYSLTSEEIEKLSDCPKITQPVSGRARIWTSVSWLPSPELSLQYPRSPSLEVSTPPCLSRDGQTSRSGSRRAQSCVFVCPDKRGPPTSSQSFQHLCYQHPNLGCQAGGFRGPRGTRHRGVGGGNWELTDSALF